MRIEQGDAADGRRAVVRRRRVDGWPGAILVRRL
jgi:hypothetical protein